MNANLARMARPNLLIERVILLLAMAIGGFLLLRAAITFMEPSRAYKSPQIRSQLTGQTQQPVNIQDARPGLNSKFDPFHRLIDENLGISPQVVIGEDAPETDLNITLKGRRASGDGSGSAVLSLPDGQESNFKQGETIFKDVVLEAIYSTHIIISRKGTQERVTFERANGLITETGAKPAPASPNVSNTPKPAQAEPSGSISNNTGPISPLNRENRRRVEALRAEKAKKRNTKTITSESLRSPLGSIRPSAVRKNGQFLGYRLTGAGQSAQLSQFGLQSSDVVTQINGQDLPQTPAALSALFEQLSQNLDSATLTIDRDGQILVLNVQ